MVTRCIFVVCTICLLWGCPGQDGFEPDSRIAIENNSLIDILVYYDFNRYPDTSVPQQNPFLNDTQYELALVSSNETKIEKNEFVKILNSSDRSMMLFIFSRDTIDRVPWPRIRDEYLVLRRYDLTLEDLETMDWTVKYP